MPCAHVSPLLAATNFCGALLSRSYPQALEKSESDRASLEKELRMLQGADGAPRAAAGSYPGDSRALDLQDSSLPVFNTRTDDTGLVALAALGCFSLAGVVMYLQHALGGNGIGGAIGGALVVGSGLIGFVLSVVVLFKCIAFPMYVDAFLKGVLSFI